MENIDFQAQDALLAGLSPIVWAIVEATKNHKWTSKVHPIAWASIISGIILAIYYALPEMYKQIVLGIATMIGSSSIFHEGRKVANVFSYKSDDSIPEE